MNFEKRIDKILKESEHDKYGGMSAGVYVAELYTSLNENEKENFRKKINETLYSSNKEKLLEYSWLVFSLSNKIPTLHGSKEIIVSRVMKEYTEQNPDKEFIGKLENYIKIIEKRSKKK